MLYEWNIEMTPMKLHGRLIWYISYFMPKRGKWDVIIVSKWKPYEADCSESNERSKSILRAHLKWTAIVKQAAVK